MKSPHDLVHRHLTAEYNALRGRFLKDGASEELSQAVSENAGGFRAMTLLMKYETRLLKAQTYHLNDLNETRGGPCQTN